MAWIDEVLKEWQIFNGCITLHNTLELIRVLQKGLPDEVKPDPQAEADIVKQIEAAIYCHDNKSSPFTSERAILQFLKSWGKTIQAGIRKNEQGIEAMRKEVEGNIRCFARIQGSELSQDLRTLEGEVKAVRKNHQEQIDKLGLEIESSDACFRREADSNLNLAIKALEERVKELEKRVKNTNINLDGHCQRPLECVHGHRFREPKPQPKGGVAYAWDKDHKEKHPLISGRSILKWQGINRSDLAIYWGGQNFIFLSDSSGTDGDIGKVKNLLGTTFTFLFDLPSCGDEGTIPGGDK